MQINVLVIFPRYLNDKQKALILAYGELEDDVNGTVNGVDKSTKGNIVLSLLKHNICLEGGGGVRHFRKKNYIYLFKLLPTKNNQAQLTCEKKKNASVKE